VRAILKMPVDLLYNGGIGTYVKAATETHQDVADPANNAVRVNGAELRARIVAEGGNLGCTQLGRIEYARAGGRINTDFIDNSAGVDLSDHEVNLKILLARPLGRGEISEEERDATLREATAEVCASVLRDNYLQGCVLTLEERRSVELLDEHALLVDELASEGLLNRAVERIPSEREIARLRESRLGLTRPQLAVLLAYAKIDAYVKVLASGTAAAPDLASFAVEYFPDKVAQRFARDISQHSLRAEIVATAAVNAAVNRMGIGFFHATARRTGASFDAILRAHLAAEALCGGPSFHAAMDALYTGGSKTLDGYYTGLARFQAAVETATRGLLRRKLSGEQLAAEAAGYGRRISELRALRCAAQAHGPALLPGNIEAQIRLAEGVAEEMDLCDLRQTEDRPLEAALQAWEAASEALLTRRLEEEAARVARKTGEDLQACESLLETAREQRRRLAASILASGQRPPLEHRERLRAQKILEAARTHEPLSLSALYVVVEALGRVTA
jgi:glutamate dehydrogenase